MANIVDRQKFNDKIIKLGNNIRKIRKDKKITQTEMSAVIGGNKGHISRIENGKHSLTLISLMVIADFLEVSVKELFEFE